MDKRVSRSLIVVGMAAGLFLGSGCASDHPHRHDRDRGDSYAGRGHGDEADEDGEDEMEGDEADEQDGADETEIKFNEAPAGVQAAFQAAAAGATPTKVIREVDEGTTTYEIEFAAAGMACSIRTSADGEMLEHERGLDASALPAAVTAALHKQFPKGTVAKCESIQSFAYECQVVVNGKKHDVTVDATGEIDDEEQD